MATLAVLMALVACLNILELRELRTQVADLRAQLPAEGRRLRASAAAPGAQATTTAAETSAAVCDCLATPTDMCCMKWAYSEERIDADLKTACAGKDTVVPLGCALRQSCESGALDAGGAPCVPFAQLASVCNGTSWPTGCESYGALCNRAGTMVPQCAANTPVAGLFATSTAVADLASVCGAMPMMSGCGACQGADGKAVSCSSINAGGAVTTTSGNLLATLAAVCNKASKMGSMGGCKDFTNMCAAQAQSKALDPLCVGGGDGCDCLKMPTMPCCASETNFRYGDSDANHDLDAVCTGSLNEQPFACAVREQCTGASPTLSDTHVCSAFTLLGSACDASKTGTAPCANFEKLCRTPDTKVGQCTDAPPLPGLLPIADAVDQVRQLCTAMPDMDECMSCEGSDKKATNCNNLNSKTVPGVTLTKNALAVLSGICAPRHGMTSMPGCKPFSDMCRAQKEGGWDGDETCGNLAPAAPPDGPTAAPFCTGATVMHMDGMHTSYGDSSTDTCLVFFKRSWVLNTRGKLSLATSVTMLMGIANALFARMRRRLAVLAPLQRLGKQRRPVSKGKALSQAKPPPAGPFGDTFYGVGLADVIVLALYTLQLMNAYALMLLVMTYYSGFFFAAVVGLALGQIVFLRHSTPAENVDPCCEGLDGDEWGCSAGNVYEPLLGASSETLEANADLVLRVDGMTCDACVHTASAALLALDAVLSVTVRLPDSDARGGRAFVVGHSELTKADAEGAVDAVVAVGFGAAILS